ncbi:transcription initiation factor IIB [Natrialbaceae archaeon A-CW3]
MATRDIYTTTFGEDVSHPSPVGTDTKCAECGGRIRTDIRDTACEECGLVLEEPQIDRSPTWYTDEEGRSSKHVGSPLTPSRHDQGLSSTIGYYRDGTGRTLSGKKQRQLGRLRQQQVRAEWATRAGRNLGYGLGEVRRITAVLGLTESVRDQACLLFRRAQREGLCVGRSLEAIAAASVYATCRCNGFPRSLGEIAETARCESSGLVNNPDLKGRGLSVNSRSAARQRRR